MFSKKNIVMHKLWIFQSNRYLINLELIEIKKKINDFLKTWHSHQHIIQSNIEIIEDRFIKICANRQNKFSINGCAIDKLVKIIKQIDNVYKLELLNRMLVSYKKNNSIFTIHFFKLKEKIKNNYLNANDLIYDLSVINEEEFNKKFLQPIKISWAKIYLS